jgi:hypothetical protein
MNVPGYDVKDKFEFGVITEFAYPIEGSGMTAFHKRCCLSSTDMCDNFKMKGSL